MAKTTTNKAPAAKKAPAKKAAPKATKAVAKYDSQDNKAYKFFLIPLLMIIVMLSIIIAILLVCKK